jgi:hypothetical protein
MGENIARLTLSHPLFVLAGLGPAIHEDVCGCQHKNSWVAGPRPAMTEKTKRGHDGGKWPQENPRDV